VPAATVAALEEGEPSANHMEQMAMGMGNLLVSQFPEVADRADELRDIGLVKQMRVGGRVLLEGGGRPHSPRLLFRGATRFAGGQRWPSGWPKLARWKTGWS
jgi:hypothetical protein